jgi:hypothetical protein
MGNFLAELNYRYIHPVAALTIIVVCSRGIPCPFRKLYPRIAMVQSAEERLDHDGAVTLDRPAFG